MQRPGWSLARLASYAVAICVHVFFVALIAAAIWLMVAMANVVTVILALWMLLLAFELRPRLGSYRKLKGVRHRDDAPVLFGVLDQVAAGIGAKPVHGVITDAQWNASYRAVGWRRRRVLTLGLPLWDALPADQKIAVLGHEFAHGVNGDARHGTVVGTSVATLARLYAVLLPDRRNRMGSHPAEGIARMVQALLSSMVGSVLMAQQLIMLRASQRAEYYADAIAARVASPASMADALDTIVTGQDTHSFVLERRGFGQGDTDFWDQMRSALCAVPDSEKERRRRKSARERLRVADTHPPAHFRTRLVHALPASGPSVFLSGAQEDKIRAELALDYARIGSRIDEAMRLAR